MINFIRKTKFSKTNAIILLLFTLLSSVEINVETFSRDIYWSTDNEARLSESISSTTLDTGTHSITITVTLLDLNSIAVDIHDIRVDFQIPGYYSSYVMLDPITSIGGSKQITTALQYSTDWGINYFQMKFTCRENIPLAVDTELYTDWYEFFLISPYEPPTTPTTPTTPSEPSGYTTPANLGLILGIIGGVIGLAILTVGTIFIVRGRNKSVSQSYTALPVQPEPIPANFCINCGFKLSSEDPFCSKCGAKRNN